jgi:hypothetical protein
MKANACFRVSVEQVAADFPKYAELAKTRTFEIFANGSVDVLLVRTDAVPEWHRQLQTAVPVALMTDKEIAALEATIVELNERAAEQDGMPEGES